MNAAAEKTAPSRRAVIGAVVACALALAMIVAIVSMYRNDQASKVEFWKLVGIEKQIADESRAFLDKQIDQAAAGAEATTIQAFAACMQTTGPHASDMEREVNLNRCEVEASQLAVARGIDQAEASAITLQQRQRLADFIGGRRSQYEGN